VVFEDLCCERQEAIEAWAKKSCRKREAQPLLTAMAA